MAPHVEGSLESAFGIGRRDYECQEAAFEAGRRSLG